MFFCTFQHYKITDLWLCNTEKYKNIWPQKLGATNPVILHTPLVSELALRIANYRPLIVNYTFQIHCLHCYSSPPKFDRYYVMPLLHHIILCNISMQVIKSVFSKLMKNVIQGVHCETMASNLIVNVVEGLVLLCCHGR